MSDEQPTQTGDLGDQPEPVIEPGEPNPGGVDAVAQDDDNIPADLGPDTNPEVQETPEPLKEELEEGEDTETEATEGDPEQDGTPPENENPE